MREPQRHCSPLAQYYNILPTKTQSPSISMELLDICIVLLIQFLLSLWWSKVWTTLRLETRHVNTFNRAAMDTGLEDWNPLMKSPAEDLPQDTQQNESLAKEEYSVMAQIIMDHGASRCFDITLAPRLCRVSPKAGAERLRSHDSSYRNGQGYFPPPVRTNPPPP